MSYGANAFFNQIEQNGIPILVEILSDRAFPVKLGCKTQNEASARQASIYNHPSSVSKRKGL